MRLIDADEILNGQQIYSCEELADFIKLIREAPTITPPPNAPLTLDEMLEIDGEPVFIVSKKHGTGWCIVQWLGVNKSWMYFSRTGTAEGMTATPITMREYGDDWLAYHRKPEEGTK